MALFNDFLAFSTFVLDLAPLYTALGKMSDHTRQVSGNMIAYALMSFWIMLMRCFSGVDARSLPPRCIISHRGWLSALASFSHLALSWLHTMPHLPCQCVVVAMSSRHLACVSPALCDAQCTMKEPTIVRWWFTVKHKRNGGWEFLFNMHQIKNSDENYLHA